MGITKNCTKFLFYSKSRGVDFNSTLTLGRLNLFASVTEIQEQIDFFGNNIKMLSEVKFKDEFSEPLFEILGAKRTDSMDFSAYERATILHDLNLPVADDLKEQFTAIVDGGTLEHVFNFPVAIKNCMEMLKTGGHFIGITPANNIMGHGFYQFSPELLYRVFSPENGFETVTMIVCAQISDKKFSDWYEVVDPAVVKYRVELTNDKPAYLLLLARKIAKKEIFKITPQQSGYQVIWERADSLDDNRPAADESRLRFIYRKYTPAVIRNALYNMRDRLKNRKIMEAGLGNINPLHFKKVDLKKNDRS